MYLNVKRVATSTGLLLFTICIVLYFRTSEWENDIFRQKSDNAECLPKNLSFLNASHPNFKSHVCLVSFPGSGNTWARHLIQEATGFYTGSVYSDKSLAKTGFPGETKSASRGDCIVYKTHLMNSKGMDKCQKIILLMRNPFHAFVAYFNFKRAHGSENKHVFSADSANFQTPRWNRFVKRSLNGWERLVLDCTKVFKGPLHLVFYEELKADVMRTIADVVAFLNLTPNMKDILCMYENREGQNHRKTKNGSQLHDVYNSDNIELINNGIHNVYAMIKHRLSKKNEANFLQYLKQDKS